MDHILKKHIIASATVAGVAFTASKNACSWVLNTRLVTLHVKINKHSVDSDTRNM